VIQPGFRPVIAMQMVTQTVMRMVTQTVSQAKAPADGLRAAQRQ
jgi:hypothetical protein